LGSNPGCEVPKPSFNYGGKASRIISDKAGKFPARRKNVDLHHTKWLNLAVVLGVVQMLTGCGTLANGRGWGQDATLVPGWDRVGKAALNAAIEPGTWAPAVGAAVFQIGSLDRNLSHWASKRTPIFGSQTNAGTASDVLNGVSEGGTLITALATPSGEQPADWALNKAKGLGVDIAAVALTSGITSGLKSAVNRTRPTGSGEGFPSGHASNTSVCDTLSARNIDCLSIPDGACLGLKIGFTALTVSTAWARVEAKQHYPSDVLGGMALGHFIGAFINDAFLGIETPKNFFFLVEPSRRDIYASVYWIF
jgi:hypothetical protein